MPSTPAAPPEASTQPADASPAAVAADGPTPVGLIALRVWAVLCVLLAGYAAVLGTVSVAAGVRHGGGGLGLGILLVALLAIAAPLLAFVPRRAASHQTWHVLSGVVMLVITVLGGQAVWQAVVLPARQEDQFSAVMAQVRLASVKAEPLQIGAVTAGWRTLATFELAQDIALDDNGQALLRMLLQPELVPAPGSKHTPFQSRGHQITLTRNGAALDAKQLRLWSAEPHFRRPAGQAAPQHPPLQAGTYQVSFDTWFWGLALDPQSGAPCVRGVELVQRRELAAADRMAVQLQAVVTRSDIGALGARVTRSFHSEAMPVAYDHAAWTQALDAPLTETCADLNARVQREAAAQALQAQDAARLTNGTALREALCARNLAQVRLLLPRTEQRVPVADMLNQCPVDASQPELFDLMLARLHATGGDSEGYCRLIERYLERQDDASLARLVARGLPALCGTQAHQALLRRTVALGEPGEAKGVAWLRRLTALKVPVCETLPSGHNLLQLVVDRGDPALITALLDAGCSASAVPLQDTPQGPLPRPSARLSWLLRVQGFERELQPGLKSLPLPEAVVVRLTERMGSSVEQELKRVQPGTGIAGPLLILAKDGFNDQFPDGHPAELVRWLAGQGARMDAADALGLSWYRRGYASPRAARDEKGQPRLPKDHSVLDGLSVDQLRQLIKPVNLATGKPGKPLDAVRDRSPGGLGAYLCQRGAIDC